MSRTGCTCDNVRKGEPYIEGRDCGRCWAFWHLDFVNRHYGGDGVVHPFTPLPEAATGGPRTSPTATAIARATADTSCRFRGAATGETVCCPSCRGHVELKVFACEKFPSGCTLGLPVAGVACCVGCTAREPVTPGDPDPAPKPSLVKTGVVVGCYGWPRLAELQIQLIRRTNGAVPILLASDDPACDDAMDRLARSYPDVWHWPNVERIGHTGGDLSAFFKGILWGASRGWQAVAKLSQRCLISQPRWLADAAESLLASGLPLSTRACHSTSIFELRTEACVLDLKAWNRPEVLSRIRPGRYFHTAGASGIAAETLLYRVLQDHLGGVFWPWALFCEDRTEHRDGVTWYHADGYDAYAHLAASLGVTLDPGFHAGGREKEMAAGVYSHG